MVEVHQAGRRVVVDHAYHDMAGHVDRLTQILDDRESLGIDRSNDDHLVAASDSRCHANGVTGSNTPAAHWQTDQIHVEQLSELAAELEPSLVAAMVGTGLAKDGGQPFVAAHDLVAGRGHVMLPATGPEKVEVLLGGLVLGERRHHVPAQLALSERRRQVDRPLEAMPGWNLLE